jgi:hypothetical protein
MALPKPLSHAFVRAGALLVSAGLTTCAPGKPIEGSLEGPGGVEYTALYLTPGTVDLAPNSTINFQAAVQLSDGTQSPAVGAVFSASGGTINSSGRYRSGTTAGAFFVIAALSGRADTSTVNITASNRTLTGVAVTPAAAAIAPGGTQQFSALGQLSDGADSVIAVNWSASGGTVTSNGLFTAPSQTGDYTVTATLQNGTLSGSADVAVADAPASLTAVVLTPGSAALQYTQSRQFAAVGQLSDGTTSSIPITWTATGGTVDGTGRYTAGSTAGNFRVIARASNGMADTSTVSVTAPTITAVILTPAKFDLQSGQTQQLTVSATLSNGGTQNNPSVTYSVAGGTLSNRIYTAGSTAGTFLVIATAANGAADTSSVNITTATITGVTVSPSGTAVGLGQTQQFTASATLSNGGTQTNPSVTWSATGGSINATGLYTAGNTAGTYQVTATLQPGGQSGSSSVSVAAPGTGPYPNRPANYTRVIGELDMSQPIPAGTGERYLAGLGNTWSVIYDVWGSGTHWQQTTDATPPGSVSPGTVWKLNMPAGSYGGGVPGVGGGTDFGAIGRPLPNLGELYISEWIKWDPTFEFHPISTKHMRLDQAGHTQAFLLQASHNDEFLRSSDEEIGQAYDPQISTMPTRGVWHQLEVVLKAGNPGTVKIWLDGVLRTNYNNRPLTGPFSTLQIDGYFGGGGMIKLVNSYYEIDHLLIAAP